MRFNVWGTPLATAAVTLIATLFGELVLHMVKLPEKARLIMIAGVFAALLVALAVAILADTITRLREERNIDHHTAALRESLPTMVRFKSRSDTISIDANGSALFTYKVVMESRLDDHITGITWPIVLDLDSAGAQFGKRVAVKRLVVNNVAQSTHNRYQPKQLRSERSGGGGHNMEYGVLTVPVDLQRGVSTCSVEFDLELTDVFARAVGGNDFVVVDIPYITESLNVEISTSVDAKAVEPVAVVGASAIEAGSLAMETTDLAETHKQGGEVGALAGAVRWQARYPKLGYRYRLWFTIA